MDKVIRVWSVCMFRSSIVLWRCCYSLVFLIPSFQNMALKHFASSRRASSLTHDIPRAERPKSGKKGEESRSIVTSDWPGMTPTPFLSRYSRQFQI